MCYNFEQCQKFNFKKVNGDVVEFSRNKRYSYIYSWLSLSRIPSISNFSLSRTRVSVPFCRLQPKFLSLSRTLSISNKLSGPLRVRDRESQLYLVIEMLLRISFKIQSKIEFWLLLNGSHSFMPRSNFSAPIPPGSPWVYRKMRVIKKGGAQENEVKKARGTGKWGD